MFVPQEPQAFEQSLTGTPKLLFFPPRFSSRRLGDPVRESARVREVVSFGAFEVDAAVRELRKNGLRIRLPEQPFLILTMLLDSPGEVVTREEIRWQLWSGETFVDYNHGINAAVKKLRRALGDSADAPRYIETVPRRGYRLIVPVEKSIQARTTSAGQLRHWLIFAAMLASAALLAMALLALKHRSRPTPHSPPRAHSGLTSAPVWFAALDRGEESVSGALLAAFDPYLHPRKLATRALLPGRRRGGSG